MNEILSSLLEAIDKAKVANPQISVYPKLIGAVISIEHYNRQRRLNEWISMLEDPHSPMKEVMAVAAKWDESTEESIAYYNEIIHELVTGLHISIEAIGY